MQHPDIVMHLLKVEKGQWSEVKGHSTQDFAHKIINTSPLQIPKSAFIQDIQSRKELQVQGHWAKVKGHTATIPPCDTPLSPNTSSLQISNQNLHSFRRYRVEGNFRDKVTEARSNVTSPRCHKAHHFH
jgi:hypothetical protein